MLDLLITVLGAIILAFTYLVAPAVLAYLLIKKVWIPDRIRLIFGIILTFDVIFLLFLIAIRIATTQG